MPISSLTRANSTCSAVSCISTVTATTTGAHGFVANTSVTISGAADGNFNGVVKIATVPTSTTFTYDIFENPVPVASGTITASVGGASIGINSVTHTDSFPNRTVTLTTATSHLITGTTNATITGISPAVYSGVHSVTSSGATTLTFSITLTSAETPPSGSTTFTAPGLNATYFNDSACAGTPAGSNNFTSINRPAGSGTLTVTTTAKIPATGTMSCYLQPRVTLPDAIFVPVLEGVKRTKPLSRLRFLMTSAYSPAVPVASGASLSTTGVTQAVTSLQRGTSNCSANPCTATVTGTVASSAGFSGNTVNITGASPSEYNGSFAVTSASGTSFTYLINTSPDRGTTGDR